MRNACRRGPTDIAGEPIPRSPPARTIPKKPAPTSPRPASTDQGDDGILIDSSGRRLSFTLSTGRQEFKDMLPILKQQALKAGLDLRLEVLDSTTGFKKVQEKNHELSLLALNRAVELYPRYWERYHGSNAYTDAYSLDGKLVTIATGSVPHPRPVQVRTQTNNMTMTFLPELDRLIEAYDRAETLPELKRLAAEIEMMIHEDAGWIPGWKLPFYRGAYWRYIKWPARLQRPPEPDRRGVLRALDRRRGEGKRSNSPAAPVAPSPPVSRYSTSSARTERKARRVRKGRPYNVRKPPIVGLALAATPAPRTR
jgi:hypothetical protein